MSGNAGICSGDFVSRFCSLGYSVLPRGKALGGAAGRNREAEIAVAPDRDFLLIYVRLFLYEAENETINESFIDVNYDQLVGYLLGHLD